MLSRGDRTIIVVSEAGADFRDTLTHLANDGRIGSWHDGSLKSLRRASTGKPCSACPLSDLDLRPDEDAGAKAERFWDGAIEGDGSMSAAFLSVMRIDDAKREAYRKRYVTRDRYVEEMASVHADAVLLPDGTFESSDGLRGRNQLHDWAVGYAERFLEPLLGDGRADGLVASLLSYRPA